jgi:outer membrane protein TolC
MFKRRHPLAALAVTWLCATAGAPAAAAQSTADVPAVPLTLEQVLALAEKRSETIAISRAGVQRAEGERTRARSGLYPQLAASASYDRALASEFEGLFDTGDLGGGEDDGDGFEDLPFGRENTWRISLSLSQNLYTGGRQTAQNRIAEAGRDAASLGVSTSRAQLLFDVTQAYYDAALSDRLVRIAEATREQADATLRQTQAGFDAGTQPEFELVRARVTRDTQTPLVIRQRANREVALLRLKQLLDLPQDFDLQLADSLGDERLPPPATFAASVAPFEQSRPLADPAAVSVAAPADIAVPDRTVVDEAAATVRLREASLSLAEAQRKPQVSLNSTYTRLAYPVNFLPAFDRSNWSVGATLNIPVLTGGRQRGDEQVARAELEQARLQLRQTQELAALDSRSAWAELIAARAAWEASAGTVQQAGRAHEIADVRYRAGVSTQLELSDARLLLQQAEVNRAQAARDLQVARARMALLPDLPLGTASPRLPQGQPQQVPVPTQPPANGPVGSNALRQTGGAQTGGFQGGGGFQAGVR